MSIPKLFLADKSLLVFFFIAIFIWKLFVKTVGADQYLIIRNNSNLNQDVRSKFTIAFYKLQYYLLSACIGATFLYNEEWVSHIQSYKSAEYEIPLKFRAYYIFETCFYINELLTMFFEPKKKDLWQMFFHHLTTLLLMKLSYNLSFYRYGVVILLLHDISDPFLEFCKTENYLKNQIAADIGFIIFVFVFFISRLIIYPKFFLWNIFFIFKSEKFSLTKLIIFILLFILQIFHVIWFNFILAVLFRIFNGKTIKDSRE